MFDELMATKIIELLEAKCPNKVERINNPNYYKYYCLVGHPIEKCFVFKDKIMYLVRERYVVLE
jgi:hypothetical protein